jgi:hypothetical protein
MIKIVLIRTIDRLAVAAAFALLAACEPSLPPVEAGQPIPPGPTPGELADYATAQMQYRFGLATGNGDVVAEANETFRQIPAEIFFRQDRGCPRRNWYARDIRSGHPSPAEACPRRNARTSNGATTKEPVLSGETCRRGSPPPISRLSRKRAPHTPEGPQCC